MLCVQASATELSPYFVVLDEFFGVEDSMSGERVANVLTGEQGLLDNMSACVDLLCGCFFRAFSASLFCWGRVLPSRSRRKSDTFWVFECIRQLLPLVAKHPPASAFFSADADTLAWVELFLHRFIKTAKVESELNADPNSGPVTSSTASTVTTTTATVPTADQAAMIQMATAILAATGVSVASTSSSAAIKAIAQMQKLEMAQKALKELGGLVQSFGGELSGEEALLAAEAAAEAAAKEASATDGGDDATYDVVDDDSADTEVGVSSEDGDAVAPE